MHLSKLIIALVLAGPAVSAFAGPDWMVTERVRDTAQRNIGPAEYCVAGLVLGKRFYPRSRVSNRACTTAAAAGKGDFGFSAAPQKAAV